MSSDLETGLPLMSAAISFKTAEGDDESAMVWEMLYVLTRHAVLLHEEIAALKQRLNAGEGDGK